MTNDFASEKAMSRVETLAERLFRHVVPIFRENEERKPDSHGTGLLVSNSADLFLISAAHVFDPLLSGANLFFYAGPQLIRKLSGSFWLTNSPKGTDRKADRYDIGVFRLQQPASPPDLQVDTL
jgi:hypothetical protein